MRNSSQSNVNGPPPPPPKFVHARSVPIPSNKNRLVPPPRDRNVSHVSEREVRGLYRTEHDLKEGHETNNETARYHFESHNEYNYLAE